MPKADPKGRLGVVAASQHGAFTLSQARIAGLSAKAIQRAARSGELVRLHPKVYASAGSAATWERRLSAALLAAGEGATASHSTAAFLLGLCDRPPQIIDITVARSKRIALEGVIVHRSAHRDSMIRSGFRLTTVPRTIVDLANSSELEAALDTAIDKRLTTIARMKAYIAPLKTNPGLRRLRRLLDDRERGSLTTEIERRFDRLLKSSPLPYPTRQHPIGGRFADFAYVDERIVIELDGGDSHMRRSVFEDDRRRQNELVLGRWLVLRFTWDDVTRRGRQVLAEIRAALEMRRRDVRDSR